MVPQHREAVLSVGGMPFVGEVAAERDHQRIAAWPTGEGGRRKEGGGAGTLSQQQTPPTLGLRRPRAPFNVIKVSSFRARDMRPPICLVVSSFTVPNDCPLPVSSTDKQLLLQVLLCHSPPPTPHAASSQKEVKSFCSFLSIFIWEAAGG